MPIVGAYIFPHGNITLDPDIRDFSGIPAVKPTSKEECIKLHNAMKQNAESLVDMRPDLIILSTPHGLKLKDNFLLLGNSKVKGDAQSDGQWTEFIAEFNIDNKQSSSLASFLKESGNPVEFLTIGEETDALPLRWGEVVPWWFINQAAVNNNFQLPPAIFIGQSTVVGRNQQKMIPELLLLGKNIFKWTQEHANVSEKKIAIVISSDLSHYHSTDPTSPYPYSEFSTVFDGYIAEWAHITRNSETESQSNEKLITAAGDLADRAGSCGYTGLVMLHGFLTEAVERGLQFQARLIYYSAPTYFGMMVNNFIFSK